MFGNLETEHLITAYRKLKRLVYYDKTDLQLRRRLSEFECNPSFDKKLSAVKKVLNSDDPLRESSFKKWLDEISFRVVPKNIFRNESSNKNIEEMEGRFISNVTSAKSYRVSKVNYFFDGPIELHLIAVIWIMFEGRILDSQLGEECYGARLEASISNTGDRSAGLFRKYHELYAQWRDLGIRKAKQLLTDEKTSVCILGLDLQEFFYRIQLDYREIACSVFEAGLDEVDNRRSKPTPSNLLRSLKAICIAYREKINPFIQLTHKDIPHSTAGIPIGLCSSPLLANWYLRNFDKTVKSKVRPAYYGRYVDDILLVVPELEDPSNGESPVTTFMDRVLVKMDLLQGPENGRYRLKGYEGLFLQQGKCILQYFDAKHSIAGLEKFQKKLEETGSAFLLMPVDEADNSLEDVAYELLYEGSVNKFRSVKGMAENRFELAKHLARQTILHLLTDDRPDPKISLGLRKFFKGKNAIEFHDLWERVLTYFLIADDEMSANAFKKQVSQEIKRVKYLDQPSISKYLMNNLETHLDLSEEMSGALSDPDLRLNDNCQGKTRHSFRYANLLRHHFVRLPLLNYTTYPGSLITRSVESSVKADQRMLELSPRYVNFDECMMLAHSGDIKLNGKHKFQWAFDTYRAINGTEVDGIEWDFAQEELEEPDGKV